MARKFSRSALVITLVIAVAAGTLGLSIAYHGRKARSNRCEAVVGAALAGQHLVLACRHSYRDDLSPDLALWDVDLSDGSARTRVDVKRGSNQWATPIGRQGDWLWVRIGRNRLSAYPIPSLSPVRSLDAALAGHAILRRGMTNNAWVSDAGAVLQGRDTRDYLVTADGQIERFDRGAKGVWSPYESDRLAATTVFFDGEQTVKPDDETLVQPVLLEDRGQVMRLEGPPGFLARSTDVVGVDANDRLSRLDATGKPLWTFATEELVKAGGLPAGPCRLRGVFPTRDAIWIVVTAATYQRYGDGNRTMKSRTVIAELDPASGKLRRTLTPHPAKAK